MNWRAFWAIFRREVKRGRNGLLILSAIGMLALASTFVLKGDLRFVVAGPVSFLAIFAFFGPLGDLRTDKTLGYIEFDRVLPISHRAMAIARLLGATVRTVPITLLILPLIVAFYREGSFGTVAFIALAVFGPLGVWVLESAFMWLLMAVNIRWNLRKLWWVPMTIGFAPSFIPAVLPEPWKRAIKEAVTDYFTRHGDAIVAFAQSPTGLFTFAFILISIPLVMLFATVSLFASGIERYTYDASAAVPMQAKPPKRELGAIGRGPTLAVTRYCIRLATEQSWRRLLLLGVFVLVLIFGTTELKGYAQFYVRALAAMIPGGIAIQLGTASARGELEGLQQLPHRPITIGAGYLLAVVVLATPGAAVWVLARAVTGMPPTVTNVLSLWSWMVAWSWIASVSTVWLNTRRTMAIAAPPLIVLATLATYAGLERFVADGKAAWAAYGAFRVSAGVAFPITVAFLMMAGGLPLFARGLAEYQFGVGKRGWFGRWAERVRNRRGRLSS
ncbi:MAG: hypothetical protein ABUL71_03600 [Gemmatimonadota bacterium]